MNFVRIAAVLLGLSTYCMIQADTINVYNKTDFDLYGGTYYFKNAADRFGEIKPILEGGMTSFDRPPLKFAGPRRKLVFSINKDDLRPRLTSSEYHILGRTSIGVGKDFYLSAKDGSFKGYSTAQWKVSEPLKRSFSGFGQKLDELVLGQVRRKYMNDPLTKIPVTVRESTALPAEEKAYQQARAPKTRAALEKLVGKPLSQGAAPLIGMCESGGGYRAMLGALGSLQGAEDTGILPATTYISALSGSTWTVGPWTQSGWSLNEFRSRLVEKIKTDFFKKPLVLPEIIQNLLMRLSFKQPVTALNMYGRMLAMNLLTDIPGGPFNLFLHQQADRIKSGDHVFPIYTAVTTKLPYQWIEFTPFEVGSDYLGGYIPVWAFGAPFLQGKMRYFTPPYSLSYILAICGSAFAARLHQVVEIAAKSIPFEFLRKALTDPLQEVPIGKFRASSAEVYNWTYGMHPLPRAQQEILKIIDGGIAYNLGLEALLRRKVNIIIINDFSAADSVGEELKKAEVDLRARGFALPPIDYVGIDKRPYSVFKDPVNKNVPVIIYIPLAEHLRPCLKNWCGTFTFDYTAEKSTQFIDAARKAMQDAAPAIVAQIKEWTEQGLNKR